METFLLLAQEEAGWLLGGFVILWILGIVFAIAATIFWIWALIDAIRNPALDDTMRIVWVLVIALTNFVGALIYFVVGRSGSRTTSPSV